jgi:hypothetical protein
MPRHAVEDTSYRKILDEDNLKRVILQSRGFLSYSQMHPRAAFYLSIAKEVPLMVILKHDTATTKRESLEVFARRTKEDKRKTRTFSYGNFYFVMKENGFDPIINLVRQSSKLFSLFEQEYALMTHSD